MERLATEDSLCGGDSLSVNTQFLGTRQEPDRRGQIVGISVDNFLPELLVVGFLRGMVEERMRILSDCRELFVITSLLWLEPEMPSAQR